MAKDDNSGHPPRTSIYLRTADGNASELAYVDTPGFNERIGFDGFFAARYVTACQLIAITVLATGQDGKTVGVLLKFHIEGVGGKTWTSQVGFPQVDPHVLGVQGGGTFTNPDSFK
jgi:hypothetical protein